MLVTMVDSLQNAQYHLRFGHQLSRQGHFLAAEACYRQAIRLTPDLPMAYNNLGWTRQIQGDHDGAVANYKRALELDPRLHRARRNLAVLLVSQGRREESFSLWHEEMLEGGTSLTWLRGLVSDAMRNRDLTLAGEYAAILAHLRWGSRWYPRPRGGSDMPPPNHVPVSTLTIPKLLHDIEQFLYLQRHGVLGNEFTSIINDYERVIDRLTPGGINVRVNMNAEDQRAIGHVYNRIVHVRDTPRVQRALSTKWRAVDVEDEYIGKAPGLVVVDEFLSAEALDSLRHFCLESTVWSANRYARGRLGAFFNDGFNCPLLLQIAEEIREVLPRVIGQRYPLRQLWGFKNNQNFPRDANTHADFAAVNVNFWITPDDANLDDTCGGLVVYEVDAPLHWDFETYNNSAAIINPFLRQQQARSTTVPYRQNRAIIFNSDLFHGTAALRFRPGYEDRRVNITMLFGTRENDVHHPRLARPDVMASANGTAAWRSAAFSRARSAR